MRYTQNIMQGTALVTGANHGLGLALTSGLLAQGWRVFAGRYPNDWSGLDSWQFPGTLHVVPLDVASTASVEAAACEVARHSASLDLLINNAGVFTETSYPTIRGAQDYDEMMLDAITSSPLESAIVPRTAGAKVMTSSPVALLASTTA